ncbi:MAG: hypothetical protein AAF320_02360 [Myxococcota bacterium]
MEKEEKKWRQSFTYCWLPALLVGCSTQSENESSHARHPAMPKKCSIQLPSPSHTQDPPQCGNKNRRFMPAHTSFFMPWTQWETAEDPESQTLTFISGHLPKERWKTPKNLQNPLWKKYGHEVSHFLDVPGLGKHEHRLGNTRVGRHSCLRDTRV